MIRRITRATIIVVLLLTAFGSIAASGAVHIRTSDDFPTCVLVSHPGLEYDQVKAMVEKDGVTYIYDIRISDDPEVLPLQLGNGTYTVRLLRHVGEYRYREIVRKQIHVDVKDENEVFLASVQNIAWKDSEELTQFAKGLTAEAKTDAEKVRNIYDYIVNNIAYDYEKACTVEPGYIPDLDQIFADKKGICYDYSSLFAGMLRSLGIPTRLVTGYIGIQRAYHAWNEVFDGQGWQRFDVTRDAATVDKLPGSASEATYVVKSVY